MFVLRQGLTFCLASASPRRSELLKSLGFPFGVCQPECDEPAPLPGELPQDYARRMAECKIRAARYAANALMAADTIVCVNNRILGKPGDGKEAFAMLQILNGRMHSVFTAVHLLLPANREAVFCEESRVLFGTWPASVLRAYADTGESLDKAGAYAIQGKGAFLVERVQGSFTNVVGLPLTRLTQTLMEENIIAPA